MSAEEKCLHFFIDLICPLLVGYMLARHANISKAFFDRIMRWNLVVTATLLALLSLWRMELSWGLIALPILGVAMQLAPGGIAYLRLRSATFNALDQGAYLLSAMLPNRGVVGSIAVFVLFGEEGYAWARLIMLFALVTLYLLCFPLAQRYYDSHQNANSKTSLLSNLFSVNQLPVLGVAAGFALNAAAINRPGFCEPLFQVAIHALAWGFLVPLGHAIQFDQLLRYRGLAVEIMGIKFLATPLVVVPLAWLMGVRGDILITVGLLAACPTAILAVVTARLHKLNDQLAMSAFVLTTIAFTAVVLPILLLL